MNVDTRNSHTKYMYALQYLRFDSSKIYRFTEQKHLYVDGFFKLKYHFFFSIRVFEWYEPRVWYDGMVESIDLMNNLFHFFCHISCVKNN